MATLRLVFPVFFSLMLAALASQLTSDVSQSPPIAVVQNPHDLLQGNCTVLKDTLIVEYMANRSAVEGGYVRVTDQFTWPPPAVIDCVKLVDRIEDGTGGYPFILPGGVGYNSVEFGYISQLSRGVKYLAKIFYRTRSRDGRTDDRDVR